MISGKLSIAVHQAFSALQLRWAASNLRKTHRLRPNGATSPLDDLVSAGPDATVNLDDLPALPGIYIFYDRTRPIFAGETAEVRGRLALHLEVSQRQGLPAWLGLGVEDRLDLKYLTLPTVGREERLSWLMRFVNEERPVLNYQMAA